MSSGRTVFSIVIPVYFNAPNLPSTVERLIRLQEKLRGEYDMEVIFVDDGSKDESWQCLKDAYEKFPSIFHLVKLTRNFGSMAAIHAGLCQARGDCIGMISADLQDPLEMFEQMLSYWKSGERVILAIRQQRADPRGQKLFASMFYWLFQRFAISDYPAGGFDFFLLDRSVLEEIKRCNEKNTHLMPLICWLGYPSVCIPYTRQMRKEGKTRWTFAKRIKLFIDSFVAFSYAPIRMFSMMGLLFSAFSFMYGMSIITLKLVYGVNIQGWAALMAVLTFTSGLQMAMLGILGEYLWRALDEARSRPSYVIEKTIKPKIL
jgi:dolichol-phosphate mannosyltransferase